MKPKQSGFNREWITDVRLNYRFHNYIEHSASRHQIYTQYSSLRAASRIISVAAAWEAPEEEVHNRSQSCW